MAKKCTLCGQDAEDLYSIAEKYVLDLIESEHPEWVEADGACKKCVEYYNALDVAVKIE